MKRGMNKRFTRIENKFRNEWNESELLFVIRDQVLLWGSLQGSIQVGQFRY